MASSLAKRSVNTHALEVRSVAHPAVACGRAPGTQHIAQGRPDQRPPRRVHVVVADPDVLGSLHCAWVAAHHVAAGGYPPTAPRDLIGGAPVEGEARGEFAPELSMA